jgi:hypothetical protein
MSRSCWGCRMLRCAKRAGFDVLPLSSTGGRSLAGFDQWAILLFFPSYFLS